MKTFAVLLALVMALPAAAAPERAADAGSEKSPADRQADLAALRQSFAELDDPDATVREQARVKLMGMERRDLPAFQAIVQESRPLTPAQAVVLRQLVVHVYLAGEPYETTGQQGFLGVRMQDTSVRVPGPGGAEPAAAAVVIVERMPGFVGARMLLDGDVILGVAERPDVRMMGVFEFQAVVQALAPGQTVHFQILRQGQVMSVAVKLDPKPFESDLQALLTLIGQRQRRAEEYWEKAFGGLVSGSVG